MPIDARVLVVVCQGGTQTQTRHMPKIHKTGHCFPPPLAPCPIYLFIKLFSVWCCLKTDLISKRRESSLSRGSRAELQEEAFRHPVSVPLPLRVSRFLLSYFLCFFFFMINHRQNLPTAFLPGIGMPEIPRVQSERSQTQ